MANIYGVLHCPKLHAIPIPPATIGEQIRAHEQGPRQIRYAVFVCPECGFAKLYSTSDISRANDTNDPFAAGECQLVEVQVECENPQCHVQKPIYTLLGNGLTEGAWTPGVQAQQWDFSHTSALCSQGHKLRFDGSRRLHVARPCSNPLLGPPFDEQ